MRENLEKMKIEAGRIFQLEASFTSFIFIFLGIISLRILIEKFIASKDMVLGDVLVEFLHNFFFFSITFLLIWAILSLIISKNPIRLKSVMLWAFWVIILPPLLDIAKTGGQVYWSFYVLSDLRSLPRQFFTFFGDLPPGIVYFGTKITFILAIISVGGFVYKETKKPVKAFLSAFLAYVIFFCMGSFPTLFSLIYTFFTGSQKILQIKAFNVAQLFGSGLAFFGINNNLKYAFAYNLDTIYFLILAGLLFAFFILIDKKKVWEIVKNSRIPQLVYHSGLLFIGMGLGIMAYPDNFKISIFSISGTLTLLVSVWLAWEASVVVNDIYDFEIDQISNADRPLEKNVFNLKEYKEIGIMFFVFSLIGGLVIGMKFAAILLMYQFLAWIYSAKPFRVKRIPGVATLSSSLASITVLFLGFTLLSGDKNLENLPWRVIFLLIIALTLSIPIKDLKDEKGDRKYGVWTIPAIFGEDKARLIIAISVFVSFLLSVFFLNETKLFWWALLFGLISFLTILDKKINPRKIFWWILGEVFLYGLILVRIVFWAKFFG